MTPEQARKTRITTDYPIDMVVGRTNGSRAIPTASSMSDAILIQIPHGLGYAPLPIGTYSDQSDFSVYYKAGSSPKFFNTVVQQWWDQYLMAVETDAVNIRLFFINWVSTRTFYYRASLLAPSDATVTPLVPSSDRQDTYINTDKNLMKIFDSKKVTYTIPSSGYLTITVPHNLGIIPKAMVWSEVDGVIRQGGNENAIGVTGIAATTTMDTANMYIFIDSFIYPTVTIHYRIYLD